LVIDVTCIDLLQRAGWKEKVEQEGNMLPPDGIWGQVIGWEE
jgi:hypothetical protein